MGNFVREADRERHPEMHNAAQAEYNRSAALVSHRAPQIPRLDYVCKDSAKVHAGRDVLCSYFSLELLANANASLGTFQGTFCPEIPNYSGFCSVFVLSLR